MSVTMISSRSAWLKSGVAAAMLLASACASALAADPTPAAVQAAHSIVAATGMSQSFDKIVPQMLFDLERNITTTRPDIKETMHQTLLAIEPEFVKTETDVVQSAAVALAKRMSEQELKDTAAFFQTASGKKYIETQPFLVQDVVGIVQAWRQKLSTEILTRAREEMKKRGIEF